jgi:lipid-binding SYLF domain-containing protein
MQRREFLITTAAGMAALLGTAGCGTTSTAMATKDSPSPASSGPSARRSRIATEAEATLSRLYAMTPGSRELVAKARGVLVFPSVIAAGLGIGGEYGDGVLRTGNSIDGYYNLAALSVGLQAGAQSRAIVFLFMTSDALEKFRASEGWSAGADASVALLRVGANGALDVNTVTGPVVAFVMTNAGLMANLNLEGTKITRLKS